VISDPKPRVSVGAFKSESAVVQRDAGGVEILPMDFCYFLEAFSSNFLGLAPNIEGRIKPMIIYKSTFAVNFGIVFHDRLNRPNTISARIAGMS
jgi:hypothetical protein